MERRTKALLVEDDPNIVDLIRSNLAVRGFDTSVSLDGARALELVETEAPDIVLLDLMLPEIDGFELCRQMRERSAVGIIVVSARGGQQDKVTALNFGADDYMTKPFSFEEFLARLRAVSRRGSAPRPTLLQVRDLVLNPATHEAKRAGEEISLSRTEFRLLEFLMRRAGRVVPRNTIVHSVWDSNDDVEENTLDAFISLLRNKVDRDHKVKLIQTVRGTGYTIRDTTKA